MGVPILMYHAVPNVLTPGLSPVHVTRAGWPPTTAPCAWSTSMLVLDEGCLSLLAHVTPLLAEFGFEDAL
jgi:hypothetical protein